jgi:hypothetical protein
MGVYRHHGSYYIHATTTQGGDGVVQLRDGRLHQVCRFGKKTKTRIKKLFPVEA